MSISLERWQIHWLAVIGVILVAAFLRLYQLDRLPVGLHYDEAVYAIQAEEIYFGARPIFFSSYTGREPLFMYLGALVYLITGPSVFGIRLTAALIGILTVVGTYPLLRLLYNRRIALVGAALLAVSYWHFGVNRTGYPWNMIPWMEVIALYMLWRGYRDNHLGWMTAGGAVAGALLYTYLPARFFPISLGLIFAYALIVDRERLLSRWKGILAGGVAAVVVFAPLGIYFLNHPEDFVERAQQVIVFEHVDRSEWVLFMLGQLGGTLAAFLPWPSFSTPYHIQGRALFNLVLGSFFLLGLLVCLRNWRRLEYMILPIWIAGMILPGMLTIGPVPVQQRIFSIAPAVYAVAAVGLVAVWRWWERRLTGGPLRSFGMALVIAVVVAEALINFRWYFHEYAGAEGLYFGYHGEHISVAEHVPAELEAGRTVVIHGEHYKHPTAVFAEPRTLEAQWVAGERTIALPAGDGDISYFVAPAHLPLLGTVSRTLDELAERRVDLPTPMGGIAAYKFEIPRARVDALGDRSPQAIVHGEIAILNSQVVTVPARFDEPLVVHAEWEVLSPVSEGRTFAVHLVDEQGLLWAQLDDMAYLWEQWTPGDRVLDWLPAPLDPAMPPGRYRVRVALTREAGPPLPAYGPDEAPIGVFVPVGDVVLGEPGADGRVGRPGGAVAPIARRGQELGDGLWAVEWSRVDTQASPGSRLPLMVLWQTEHALGDPLEAVIEVVDGAGQVWHSRRAPLTGEYPTTRWEPGELVRGRYLLTLPPEVQPGTNHVRLRVDGVDGVLNLGAIHVDDVARRFDVPPIETPLVAQVGEAIRLLGYDLEARAYQPGETFNLKLYWQAVDTPPRDLKVFVHLARPDETLLTQADTEPVQGRRPTTGWAPDEVLVDEYQLAIPTDASEGTYRVFVGMYDPETLAREPLLDAAGERQPHDRLHVLDIQVTR